MGHRPHATGLRPRSGAGAGVRAASSSPPAVGMAKALWHLGNTLSGVSGYFFYRETRLFVLGLDVNTYTIYTIYYSRSVAASVGFNIVYEASPQSKRKELN